ncbi:N-alpha-acetyltransferase 38-B, NatC auxiliary subunit [Colletotrichum sidae]|uniref:N-alpha-acetyltransferase 38-B, NatC auxiliary subunit n=1 Tax=Colletotrichum sidae TaxID=1347389 RepID=A0A4R8TVW2_9PEZI|nr:N-alpha-acetyltransferase 38-B, NatC auxiliary subunit [Colletotrichum sidae]
MENEAARDFLTSLLNKNLRVVATDGRMFLGQFKCTDPVTTPPSLSAPFLADFHDQFQERNVVLAHTYEYRQPSAQQRAEAAQNSGGGTGSVKLDMTSRYLGLIVVPGEHIVKIEVEEFVSQIRGQNPYATAAVV